MATIFTPFTGWLTPMVRIGPEKLAEIIQLELHRYVLAKTNKNGLIYDQNGDLDVCETSAAFHLLYMCERLSERMIVKALPPLKEAVKSRLEAEGRTGGKKLSLFSLTDFFALTLLEKLFELAVERNIFQEFGYEPAKLVKQYLSLFRKPDKLFAEMGRTGESSLFSTAQAVWILKAHEVELADFDPKLEPAIKAVLPSMRRTCGGYFDNPAEPIGSIPSTFAGCYLSSLLFADGEAGQPDAAFAEATNAFIERLKAVTGGYRADGLTPMPTLNTTLLAVLAYGMNNDYKYRSLPKKEIISYLNLLERRDSGAAANEWSIASNVQSTLIGLVIRLLLGDKFVM